MTKSAPRPTSVLETFAAVYVRTRSLLAAANESQWQAGRSIKPRVDTTERATGSYSDSTFQTASDERRLELRAAVLEAERAVAVADHTLRVAALKVAAALAAAQATE